MLRLSIRSDDASLYFANWLYLEVMFDTRRMPSTRRRSAAIERATCSTFARRRGTSPSPSRSRVTESVRYRGGWHPLVVVSPVAPGGHRRRPRAESVSGVAVDVQCGDIDDEAIEPTRPDRLGTLTPPLESCADIIGLDRDFVAVAAQGAAQVSPPGSAGRWICGGRARHERAHRTALAGHAWMVAREHQERQRART